MHLLTVGPCAAEHQRDPWTWTIAALTTAIPVIHAGLKTVSDYAALLAPIVGVTIALLKLGQMVRKELARRRAAEEAAAQAAQAATPPRAAKRRKPAAKSKGKPNRAQVRTRRR